jgi:8-oxo-dGTP pyrophosphatase MutT (NUDIX family)
MSDVTPLMHVPVTIRYPTKYTRHMECINCGGIGHTARKCNGPITSCGIICCRKNSETQQMQYLMIQKRNSLNYVEFIRGKYDIVNKDYLLRLIGHITNEERELLKNNDFDTIWRLLWINDMPSSKRFTNSYHDSKRKFEKLKRGFQLRDIDGTIIFFGITYLLNNTAERFIHTEWEFPKGRRQINERDLTCALREFQEEAGMSASAVTINNITHPMIEVFVGNNNVRYKHIYYIGTLIDPTVTFNLDPNNIKQCGEVRNIAWCDLDEALDKTRAIYVERKELLKRLHRMWTTSKYVC